MDEKISLKALGDYSDDYASKVTASFFSSKERITGPEIMKVCDIHQINLFVIRELLHAWKHEAQKLRSPFFDYSSPVVTDALAKFQNLLSNHISISRENFQPLLKKAVGQALYLILDPYDFYADTLDSGLTGTMKIEDLRNEIKYVKVNATPLEKLLHTLEEKKIAVVKGSEAFGLLDRILEEVNFTPEDLDGYITQFSKITPLSVEKLYEKKTASSPAPVEVKTESFPPPKAENVRREEPKKNPPTPAPPAQATLYDQLAKGAPTTLAEDFQKRKKIKDTLTINQKFMFTKILFNGDFELFSTAIDRLDDMDNMSQANNYLDNNYGEWNKETEEYQEFMEIVVKRFA